MLGLWAGLTCTCIVVPVLWQVATYTFLPIVEWCFIRATRNRRKGSSSHTSIGSLVILEPLITDHTSHLSNIVEGTLLTSLTFLRIQIPVLRKVTSHTLFPIIEGSFIRAGRNRRECCHLHTRIWSKVKFIPLLTTQTYFLLHIIMSALRTLQTN